MANRALKRKYRNAPPEMVEQLAAFRDAHKEQRLTVEHEEDETVGWDYVVGGEGDETIVFIHGVGAINESHFMQIQALEEDYHVIAPTIPGAPTMLMLAQGLATILDEEGVDAAHIFGVSFGGMVAQAFAAHHPDRVKSLILSHTMAPREDAAPDFVQQRQATKSMPRFLYGSMARMAGMKALKTDVLDLDTGEQAFWKTNFNELYPDVVTKSMFQARLEAGEDFQINYEFPEGGPEGFDGPVLIIESSRDTNIEKGDRERLRETYPDAEVHTITRYGHMGALVRVEPSIDVAKKFIG